MQDLPSNRPDHGQVIEALHPDALAQRVVQAQHDARGADARATVETYGYGIQRFAAWCDETGREYALPVDPRTLAAFIDDVGAALAPKTVSVYVTAINRMHSDLNLPVPGAASVVKLAMRRMKRAAADQGRGKAKQAPALQWATIAPKLDALGDTLPEIRDAALIALAYDTMFRASELVGLRVRDISEKPDGCGVAFIGKSKTDQEGQGDFGFIAPDTLCRVKRLVDVARLDPDAFLFFGLSTVGDSDPAPHLSPRDVTRIYKRRIGQQYTAHSTRVGSSVDQGQAGVDVGATARAGRWKSTQMVLGYQRESDVAKAGAAQLARLQGRA